MKSVYIATCLASLAAATTNFEKLAYADSIAKEDVDETCDYPTYYTVSNLETYTPTSSNETEVNFGFVDADTDITTTCSLNSTSVDIAEEGRTAKYACDNSLVEFYWQNSKLTLVEVACPTSS